MKNWIIERKGEFYTYLIISEKSIWITEQHKVSNIQELIKNKNLGNVKSFRYDQLKEIILIETNSSLQFSFKDKDEENQSLYVERNVFREIRTFLKLKLSGVSVKNYSILKQITSQLSTLGFGIVFIFLTYQTAIDLENGVEITAGRKRSIIKKIVLVLAELIGVYGTIALGTVFVAILIFFINKKLQNPEKGEIIVFGKFVDLKK